jgi:hypothetical protein
MPPAHWAVPATQALSSAVRSRKKDQCNEDGRMINRKDRKEHKAEVIAKKPVSIIF